MAKSTAFAGALLDLILNNTAISGLTGTLYVSLHTADPGVGGTQATSEADYPGYARVAVARDAAWTISGNQASPVAAIEFPESTGPGTTVTHFAIGLAATGAGVILYSAALVDASGDPLPKPITGGDTVTIGTTSTITES